MTVTLQTSLEQGRRPTHWVSFFKTLEFKFDVQCPSAVSRTCCVVNNCVRGKNIDGRKLEWKICLIGMLFYKNMRSFFSMSSDFASRMFVPFWKDA